MTIVAPSQWLASCAAGSSLMRDWPLHVVPPPLDTSVFRPLDMTASRRGLGLPLDMNIVLFGMAGGGAPRHKGFDLFLDALRMLEPSTHTAVIFGQEEPAIPPRIGLPLRWMGHIDDDHVLAMLYSSADVMVVPSRQEAFGQTASEAQACGTPVVAFRSTGLLDVVAHLGTGYLAEPYSPEALAQGIRWILERASRRASLGHAARDRALQLWDSPVVAAQYSAIYELAVDRHRA